MSQVQTTEPVVEQFVPIDGEVAKVEGRTPWQLFWGRFRHDKIAMLALIWVILLVVSAFLAPLFVRLVAHNGPNDIHPELSNEFNIGDGPTRPIGAVWTRWGATSSFNALQRTSIRWPSRDGDLGRDRARARPPRRLLRRQDRHLPSTAADIFLSLPVFLLAMGSRQAGSASMGASRASQARGWLVTVIIAFFGWTTSHGSSGVRPSPA
jgi:ABC-type dipeptide/oligopeptide/nickel transport system permease subunit